MVCFLLLDWVSVCHVSENRRRRCVLQDHDEPILKHLEDIKVKFSDPGQPMVSGNNSLEDVTSTTCHRFYTVFSSLPPLPELHIRVPLFSQRLLHKHSADKNLQDEVRAWWVWPLLLRRARDHQLYGVSPLPNWSVSLTSLLIVTVTVCLLLSLSCTINWTKGKNVTLKTIKKKQKHKGRGTVRTVTKTVPNDSFFNFFTPPEGRAPTLWNSLFFLLLIVLFQTNLTLLCLFAVLESGELVSSSFHFLISQELQFWSGDAT